ncbi:MAG: hypothetical protein M3347_00025, partial [Armatimonadota bacterium]|nr:hypothetical protein [Armatimonadota bacterium]
MKLPLYRTYACERVVAAGFSLRPRTRKGCGYKTALVLVVLSSASYHPVHTAPASTGAIVLRAGSLKPNGVALRWTVKEGWLPEGGFNVYRIENGKRSEKPLNATPLGANPGSDGSAKFWQVSPRFDVSYKDAVKTARKLPAGVQETQLRSFADTTHVRPASSRPVFKAMGTHIRALRTAPGPALPPQKLQMRLMERPEISQYVTALRGPVISAMTATAANKPAKAPTTVIKTSTLSPVEQVQELRSNLLLGALVNPEIGKDLGLAFDDKTAVAGATYQYALRAVGADKKESPQDVATVQITVGADCAAGCPPAPALLEAEQFDADTVDLRWERPTPEQAKNLGLPSYRLIRVDKEHPAGLPVNKSPIIIADIPAAGQQGGYVEPRAFFHDNEVPIGEVTYRLILMDIFGRESAPAELKFTMEDWHTPPAPEMAEAELKGNDVTVAWSIPTPPAGLKASDVRYRVYRVDMEQKNATPVLLTAAPITGESFDAGKAALVAAGRGRPGRLSTMMNRAGLIRGSVRPGGGAGGVIRVPPQRQSELTPPEEQASVQLIAAGATVQKAPPVAIPKPSVKTNVPPVAAPPAAGMNRPYVWLSFTDKNVPQDHYFRYIVTSLYTRNNRDSTGTVSSPVPVPFETAPPAPTNLKLLFTAGPPRASATGAPVPVAIKPSGSLGTVDSVATRVTALRARIPAAFLAKVRAADPGGTVTLTWAPVAGTKPITYRIYRASATGYFPATKAAADSATTPEVRAHAEQAPALGRKPIIVPGAPPRVTPGATAGGATGATAGATAVQVESGGLRINKDLQFGPRTLRYVEQVMSIPPERFALIGQVKDKTSFADTIPRSQAHYYVYQVVAVNRWNVPAGGPKAGAAGAESRLRVPATMPPSVPALQSVAADSEGNIMLRVQANLKEEEVVRYHVFRKPVEWAAMKISQIINYEMKPPAAGAIVIKPQAGPTPGVITAKPTAGVLIGAGSTRFGIVRRGSLVKQMGIGRARGGSLSVAPATLKMLYDANGYLN